MIRASLVVALLSATQASALSCVPASPQADFKAAAASDTLYVIVEGMLKFDERKLPVVDYDNQAATPPETHIPAFFDGHSLGYDGFTNRFKTPVSLIVECWGPWCGGAETGMRYVAFAEKSEDGYTLRSQPCPGYLYGNPTPGLTQTLQQCFSGGVCDAPHD